MKREEQVDFVNDGRDAARRERFRASQEAVQAWERAHPRSLDDYLDFLGALQVLFGPFPIDRRVSLGRDFLL